MKRGIKREIDNGKRRAEEKFQLSERQTEREVRERRAIP